MIPKKTKEWIDNTSYEDLLRRWGFGPTGDPMFQGEMGTYYEEVMRKKRAGLGDVAATRVSKNIGWKK